jgi:hypothetical protein
VILDNHVHAILSGPALAETLHALKQHTMAKLTPSGLRTPTAFRLPARGCAPRATPGDPANNRSNPERVSSARIRTSMDSTLFQGWRASVWITQGRLPAPSGAALRAACGRLWRSAPLSLATLGCWIEHLRCSAATSLPRGDRRSRSFRSRATSICLYACRLPRQRSAG